jgi:hypothetical protein
LLVLEGEHGHALSLPRASGYVYLRVLESEAADARFPLNRGEVVAGSPNGSYLTVAGRVGVAGRGPVPVCSLTASRVTPSE